MQLDERVSALMERFNDTYKSTMEGVKLLMYMETKASLIGDNIDNINELLPTLYDAQFSEVNDALERCNRSSENMLRVLKNMRDAVAGNVSDLLGNYAELLEESEEIFKGYEELVENAYFG